MLLSIAILSTDVEVQAQNGIEPKLTQLESQLKAEQKILRTEIEMAHADFYLERIQPDKVRFWGGLAGTTVLTLSVLMPTLYATLINTNPSILWHKFRLAGFTGTCLALGICVASSVIMGRTSNYDRKKGGLIVTSMAKMSRQFSRKGLEELHIDHPAYRLKPESYSDEELLSRAFQIVQTMEVSDLENAHQVFKKNGDFELAYLELQKEILESYKDDSSFEHALTVPGSDYWLKYIQLKANQAIHLRVKTLLRPNDESTCDRRLSRIRRFFRILLNK